MKVRCSSGNRNARRAATTDAEAGRIFRLFLQVRSVERGVIVKLAGHVTANPTTGRLQATFTQQPQLPFSELLLTFNGGARASLANPQTCGTFTTTTDLTPWSAPRPGRPVGHGTDRGHPRRYAVVVVQRGLEWCGWRVSRHDAVQPVLQRGQPDADGGRVESVRGDDSVVKIANRTSPVSR